MIFCEGTLLTGFGATVRYYRAFAALSPSAEESGCWFVVNEKFLLVFGAGGLIEKTARRVAAESTKQVGKTLLIHAVVKSEQNLKKLTNIINSGFI